MENPRHDSNLGTMICFHKKYLLGDKHEYKTVSDFLIDLLIKTFGDRVEAGKKMVEVRLKNPNEPIKDFYNKVIDLLKDKYIVLPVYLMDHSSLTISTSDFNDRWDSGQVGWIYVEREKAKKEYGETCYENLVRIMLIDEVNLYNEYLNDEEDEDEAFIREILLTSGKREVPFDEEQKK